MRGNQVGEHEILHSFVRGNQVGEHEILHSFVRGNQEDASRTNKQQYTFLPIYYFGKWWLTISIKSNHFSFEKRQKDVLGNGD